MKEEDIIKIINRQNAKHNCITLAVMFVGYGSFYAYKFIKGK